MICLPTFICPSFPILSLHSGGEQLWKTVVSLQIRENCEVEFSCCCWFHVSVMRRLKKLVHHCTEWTARNTSHTHSRLPAHMKKFTRAASRDGSCWIIPWWDIHGCLFPLWFWIIVPQGWLVFTLWGRCHLEATLLTSQWCRVSD